ncbi:MAG: acyltransferase [Caulobacter sp.]|nr:acyltransferase [Caulobacter sp.]
MISVLKGPGLFRLTLAILVFAHHISRIAIGQAAVYVFFALSGYWVTTMWSRKYSATRQPYLTFLTSRLWRVLPVFLLISAGMLLWRPEGHTSAITPHLLFSQMTMLGYALLRAPPLVPAWSLDIELQFYLVTPLVVVMAARWPLAAIAATGTFCATAVCLGWPDTLPKYLVFFLLGAVASDRSLRASPAAALASIVGFVLVVLFVLASPWRGLLLGGSGDHHALTPLANCALALTLLPFALFTVTQPSGKADAAAGDLSYIVYLLHWPAALWLAMVAAQLPTLQRLPYAGLAVGGTLALGLVIWAAYDRPINRLRARWVASRLVTDGRTTAQVMAPTATAAVS